MKKKLLIITSIFGMFAVILGAFGAHALTNHLGAKQLKIYQTGIDYHYYHTLALFGISILIQQQRHVAWLHRSAVCFIIGILLFSGSLYLLACRGLLSLEKWTAVLGPLTPIGGTFFIAGWLMLLIYALKNDFPSA